MASLLRKLTRFLRRSSGDTTSGSGQTAGGTNYRLGVGIDSYLSAPMTVATVFCCVSLLSESVAKLPVQVMRRRGEIYVDDRRDSLHFLMNQEPDSAISAFDFWRQAVMEVLLEGNAYIVPVYSPAVGYIRLGLCTRGTVGHDTTTDTYTVSDINNGIYGTFREDEIIHFKGMPGPDPKRGRGVISYARETASIASAGNSETLDRFENGGVVRGIVGNDSSVRGYGDYQDRELERAAEDIEDLLKHGRRIVSRPGAVDFKQFTMTSSDMEFLSSRKFTVREICRFFRVPPSYVYDDTSNNYKSAEMASSDFLSNTLDPLLRKIETELNRKLIGLTGYGRRKIEFDRKGIFACDLSTQVNYLGKMIQAGLYTPNEARVSINRAPLEGGDKMLVSANLRSIETVTSEPAAGAATPENGEHKTENGEDGEENN